MPERIDPTAENREPVPPCGGSFTRDPDGGLRPADQATAEAAGLDWQDTIPAPLPDHDSEA